MALSGVFGKSNARPSWPAFMSAIFPAVLLDGSPAQGISAGRNRDLCRVAVVSAPLPRPQLRASRLYSRATRALSFRPATLPSSSSQRGRHPQVIPCADSTRLPEFARVRLVMESPARSGQGALLPPGAHAASQGRSGLPIGDRTEKPSRLSVHYTNRCGCGNIHASGGAAGAYSSTLPSLAKDPHP